MGKKTVVLSVKTNAHNEMIDITASVENAISATGITDGFCMVYVPHTTAGVTINENADPSVRRDILSALKHIVPDNLNYTHMEGNSTGHIKASLMGSSVTIGITDGKLVLGTWQGIFFCEFDGPRQRKAVVSFW